MQGSDDEQRSRQERTNVARKQREVPAVVGREDDEYNMKHPRRGIALIFNHQYFERLPPRRCSETDAAAVTKTFQKLGFETRIHTDITALKLIDLLKRTAEEDHGDCDCLVVAVMTHGNTGMLYCLDARYTTNMLWTHFTADRCPSLAGKPKLFFIEASRGAKADVGVRMQLMATHVDSVSTDYTLPICADILIAYSTVQDYITWQDTIHGSWFIQALCEELDKHDSTRDLHAILALVCRRVAVDYQSSLPGNEVYNNKKQVPAFTSTLTRRVFFRQPL